MEYVDGMLYMTTGAELISVEPGEEPRIDKRRDIGFAYLSKTGEGELLLGYESTSGVYVVEYVERNSLMPIENISFNIPFSTVSGGQGRELYMTTGSAAYRFDFESRTLEKLFTWAGIGLRSGVMELVGEKLVTTASIDNMKSNPPVVLGKIDLQTENISVIRLAITDPSGPSSIVQEAILSWNALNPQCPIEVVDYSVYNSQENDQAAAVKLGTDIINGNMPDMFDFSLANIDNLPSSAQFARRGLLEDLYPYIDADPELDRTDFIPGIMAGMEINGGLYELAPIISLMTTFARTSVVGDERSYAGLEQAVASSEQYELIYSPDRSRSWLLGNIVNASSAILLDWNTCQCYFDSDYFRGVLESLKNHPDDEEPISTTNYSDVIRESRGLLYPAIANELYFATNGPSAFGAEDYCFPGYPELGSVIYPTCSLSMSAYSQNKEQCWQFMRQFLLKENSQNYYMSPRKDCIDISIEKWEELLNENGLERFVEERVEAMNRFKPLLLETTNVYRFDSQILDIVRNESWAYFNNDKSLDEVVKQIQSRVSIYMAEQNG